MIEIMNVSDHDDMTQGKYLLETPLARDLQQIEFPSDKISIKHLRRHFPARFDSEPAQGDTFGDYFVVDSVEDQSDRATRHLSTLADLLSCERAVAAHLLTEGRGRPLAVEDKKDREAARSLLIAYYQELRLANSEAEAQGLVEEIAANVRQHLQSTQQRQ